MLAYIFSYICYVVTYPFVKKGVRYTIGADFKSICSYREISPTRKNFISEFAHSPEFRSVVYFRLLRRYRLLPQIFLKPQTSTFISMQSDEVGEGLMLMHGFSTIINARRVGKNCTFFQQVTVGYSCGAKPVIEDDCTICAGAEIIGNVTIGRNSTVGAGAVVVDDVPENSVVVGNPARVVSQNYNRKSNFVLD